MPNKTKYEIADKNSKQNRILRFLYKSKAGRALLNILIKPEISKAAGYFMDSVLSVPLIRPFIKLNHIDMSDYVKCSYNSFNEFFTRRIKEGRRSFSKEKYDLCSPCDSKLSVYRITDDAEFMIKDTHYNMKSLTGSSKLTEYFKDGYLCVFRLSVDDYHRYAYIDNGKKTKNYHIQGFFHTVNPVAGEEFPVYKENTREFSLLKSENFGRVLMMEVGAMLVGRIVNNDGETYVSRGQEKGRFEYGGSTVILAFEKAMIDIDEEILNNTKWGFETRVRMGECIGKRRFN